MTSMSEQPETTAELLELPVSLATPLITPRVLSLGPEAVTNEERAKKKAEQRAAKRPPAKSPSSSNPKPKKSKLAPPRTANKGRSMYG